MSYLGVDPSKVTRKEILEIAHYSPAVSACVEFWRQGYCTWEQSMMLAVKILFELTNDLQKRVMDKMSTMPPAIIKWFPPEESDDG